TCGHRLFRAISVIQQFTTMHFLRRANERVQEREDRLLRFNRAVSHELKNRIGAAGGASSMLQEDSIVKDPEQLRKFLSIISLNVAAMSQTLSSLVELSTLEGDREQTRNVLLPEAAAEVTGTGWGTLKGTFKYVGDPPAPGKFEVTKDTEVCGRGGIADNSLLVGSDHGIANIVIYARAKRIHESAQPLAEQNDAEPLLFDQKQCMFLSHVVACQVNRKVEVKNSDGVGHNTKIDPQKGLPFNQTLANGQVLPYTPIAEEAIPAAVSCSIHPWMRAYLLPRKDKYFAVTKSDGSFEIPNLPAGEELELQVWHERGSGPGGAVSLPRKDLKWTTKGRFKVKLEPDQTLDLAFDVPPTALKQ
ncbi:MAG: histidine kinase dimerization/phospho-acceptor domain-containing protein, partial [Pirellulales bacterium]